MSKSRYVWIIIAIVGIIVVGGILVLFNIKKVNTEKEAIISENSIRNEDIERIGEQDKNVILETNGIEAERITPKTTIIFNKYYKQCGHLISRKEEVTENMVNTAEEEFTNLYKDWNIEKFSSSEIILYKEFEGECGEHYIVKENEDLIYIYRKESDGNLTLIEKTEISTKYLPQIDREKLIDGVELNGKEELNSYIEDFE